MVQLATGRRTKCVPIIEPEIKHTREQTEVKLGRELGPFLHGSLLPCCRQMKQRQRCSWLLIRGIGAVSIWLCVHSAVVVENLERLKKSSRLAGSFY